MKLIFALSITFLISLNLISQTSWFQQNSGTTLDLYDIQFINANIGYIAAGSITLDQGRILKTTNSGLNWLTVFSFTGSYFLGLKFIDSNTGTVVGTGPFRKTTNGGNTWISQPNPYLPGAKKIDFIDANTAMAVGFGDASANGGIIYSTDGGNTWLNRSFGHDNIYEDVALINSTTAIITGIATPSSILRTTNAGLNWTAIPVSSSSFKSLSFVNQTNGMVCGSGGEIYLTTDSGLSWNQVYSAFNWYGLHNFNNSAVAVGSSGQIVRSTNNGFTWSSQNSGVSAKLNAVWFIDDNTGWAVGNSGIILKTTSGGWTAVQPISSEIPNEFKLYQNYPNPFNPTTNIKFQIPRTFFVKIIIYDLLGREIAILVNERLTVGNYEVEWDAINEPSGTYFYTLQADNYKETKKLVLLK